jgi:peroxiredoxin
MVRLCGKNYNKLQSMKKITATVVCLLITATAFAQKTTTYKISGTITGFEDNLPMYLSDLSDGSYKDIDSTIVKNGKFSFTGKLHNKAGKYAIHTKDFQDRVAFWVDQSPTSIVAEKGKFRTAAIKGSKEQLKSNELNNVKDEDFFSFIKNNPSYIVSADLLNIYKASWSKDTVSRLYNLLTADAKNSIYGKRISNFLTLNQSPKVGDQYIDFTEMTMEGKSVSLSDYAGKIVLLEFWGSWCMPCREGHPELIKTYQAFKDKGFDILGVAADNEKKRLLEAIQKDGLPWQNVSDLQGDQTKPALIYGVSYYPANYLIDRNGIIIAKDLRDEKLYAKLKELLP